MKFRTVEGQQGTLLVFVTPNIQPKVSQMRSYPIRPLSLHVRTHTFDETRPLNMLTLRGSFSHAEIHNWIKNCVPEVPDKLQVTSGERSVLYFKNVFSGTSLTCEYWWVQLWCQCASYIIAAVWCRFNAMCMLSLFNCSKGQADFKTENVSTISILKDFITKEATRKRVKLEIGNSKIFLRLWRRPAVDNDFQSSFQISIQLRYRIWSNSLSRILSNTAERKRNTSNWWDWSIWIFVMMMSSTV